MLRAEIVLLEDDGLYCVGAKGAEGRELYWSYYNDQKCKLDTGAGHGFCFGVNLTGSFLQYNSLLEDDGLYCVGAKGAEGRELYWRKDPVRFTPKQISLFMDSSVTWRTQVRELEIGLLPRLSVSCVRETVIKKGPDCLSHTAY
jgi:hypothetical protein